MSDDRRVGHDLLKLAVGIHLKIDEVERFPDDGADEDVGVRLRFRVVEDDLEFLAFPILFTIGVQSFAQAVPVGVSEKDFEAEDEWSLPDLIEHLRYVSGRLELSTDYIRGRRMKTDVTIYPDGRVLLETRGRGSQAEGWIDVLKGEKPKSSPEDAGEWS